MKFIANHRIEMGAAPNVQILHAGDALPPMDVEELLRLQDLGAITGLPSDDQASATSADEAGEEAAATPAQ